MAVATRRTRGRGPTLVLLHGAAGNHHSFDELLDALDGREVVTVSLPGRPGTEGAPLGTAAEAARWVTGWVEENVDGPWVVAGHSMGGGVALEVALSSPAGLRGVALMATGARLRVHPVILGIYEQAASTGRAVPPPPGLFLELDAEGQQRVLGRCADVPAETALADWRLANGFDRMANLSGVVVPTCVVAGSADALTPAKYAKYMADEIPDATLHVLEGAGHMLTVERADAVAELLDAFLDGLGADGATR